MVIVAYVDDLFLAGDDMNELNSLKTFLDDIKIKYLGSVYYFLGLEVIPHQQGYFMSQQKYISDLLAEFYCENFTPTSTLLDPSVKLDADIGDPISDPSTYRRLVGKLNFLQHTRSDVLFSIQHLSQFLQALHVTHMITFFHVLRYLMNDPAQDLLLSTSSDFSLLDYLDLVACAISRRSVTCFYITLGGSPISWKSKKQSTVALSSSKAEY